MLLLLVIILTFCCCVIQSQIVGDICLRDGPFERKGRLEVFYASQWGTVCDDSFDDNDAAVACRQLGYSTGFIVLNIFVPDGTGDIWLDDMECSGVENRLDKCKHNGWGMHNCHHDEDVGVECFASLDAGTLRIIEDTLPMQGRLEVYYNGNWGTICDDVFGDVDALVACRQMGYSTGVTLGNDVTDGSGTILIDNLSCSGTESTIASCGNEGWGVHNCQHSEDVGVQCFIKNKVDGLWGSWSSWESCSLTCGDGLQYRSRICNNPTPINGGNYCEGISYNSQVCNSNVCSADITWATWETWSVCPVTCGTGIRNRTRWCNNTLSSNGGNLCNGSMYDMDLCNTHLCPQEQNLERPCCSPVVVVAVGISCIVLTIVCGLAVVVNRKRLTFFNGEPKSLNNRYQDAHAGHTTDYDNVVYAKERSINNSSEQQQHNSLPSIENSPVYENMQI